MHQLNLFFTGKGEAKKKPIRVNVTHGKQKKTHISCSNEPFFLKYTCAKQEKKPKNKEEAKTKHEIIHMQQQISFFTGKVEAKKKKKAYTC